MAIFYNTKDVEVKGNLYVYTGLSVLGDSVLKILKTTSDITVLGKLETNEIKTATSNDLTISNNALMTQHFKLNGTFYHNSFTKEYTPFHCAGKVNGSNLAVQKSLGRSGFAVERASGFGTGIYKIIFNEPYPDANYIIQLTTERWATFIISWDTKRPTATDFHVVIYNTSNALENAYFYFNIL